MLSVPTRPPHAARGLAGTIDRCAQSATLSGRRTTAAFAAGHSRRSVLAHNAGPGGATAKRAVVRGILRPELGYAMFRTNRAWFPRCSGRRIRWWWMMPLCANRVSRHGAWSC